MTFSKIGKKEKIGIDALVSENIYAAEAMPGKIYNYYLQLIIYLIAFIIILTPIFRGLYFPREWYLLNLISFTVFSLLIVLHLFISKNNIFNQPVDFAVLLFGLFYGLSYFFAVYTQDAISEFLKAANYVILYMIIRTTMHHFKSYQRYILFLLNSFIIAGLIVSVVGLTAAAGALEASGLYDGTRIHSTIQYHNANGIYMAAMFLLAVGISALQDKWQDKILYLGAAQLFFLSVILTYSRGAWLVLAFCILVYLLLALPGQRFRSAVYISFIVGLSLVAIGRFEFFISANNITAVYVLLLILVAILSVLVYLVECFTANFTKKNKNTSVIILVAVSFCITVFSAISSTEANHALLQEDQNIEQSAGLSIANSNVPAQSVINRISEINLGEHSVTERFIYYRTALKIFCDYPLTGAGGGAWEALYLDYLDEWHPDFMHTVEVHNHYLKILIEAGIFGLLSFLAIWFFFIRASIRTRFSRDSDPEQKQMAVTILTPALALGAHAAIDFSLSLGAISIMLWILFALGISNADEKPSPFIQRHLDRIHSLFPKLPVLLNLFAIFALLALLAAVIYNRAY